MYAMLKLDKFFLALLMLYGLSSATAQNSFSVQGKVLDQETEEPLIGVNITIVGASSGTATDFDGMFSLENLRQDDSLLFSYIGYESKVVSVNAGSSLMDVRMTPDSRTLDQVVVVGYGKQRRSDITGAISTVSADDIEGRTVVRVEEALQGLVPGLKIARQSGQPGAQEFDFQIRGTSTFSNNPVLTIIDGVPSNLANINPNDIESISVLKDAASTAIYGSRATGGVILVTTKTGKVGKPKISINSSVSLQQPTRFASKVSAYDHMIAQNQMRANDGGPPKFSDEEIQDALLGNTKEWDWDDFMFKDALQTNQNISISGGTESMDYYFSLGYLNQDGIFLNSNFERFNIQLNQNIRLGDKFKLSYRAGYVPSIRQSPADARFSLIAQAASIHGIISEDGKWLTHPERTGAGRNPIAAASEDGGEEIEKRYGLVGNASLEYSVLPNLSITGSYGISRNNSRVRNYQRILEFYDQFNPDQLASRTDWNILDINNSSNVQQNVSLISNYNKDIGDHTFSILGGVTAEWYFQENDRVNTRDFITDEIFVIDAGTNDKSLWNISGSAADWALTSLIGRATYSYKNKYLLEGNLRYDGSSRFSEDIRWGLFPSASAGWIISKEDFLVNNRVLTFLKLRLSWGRVGNQNVGFYPFANILEQTSSYFGGQVYRGIRTAGASNPLLTWETKETLNFGLEGSVFSNLLEFNLELFKDRTSDILLNLPLPTTFGQASPVQNAGVVENVGWELELRHRNKIGSFGYGIGVQISDAVNEVIDMGGVSPVIQGNTITEEGHSLNEWYGLEAIGIFQTDEEVANHSFQNPATSPGDLKYAEHGGDPTIINSADRVRLGRSDARFPFGVSVNMSFKNFDFSVLGQGVLKNFIYANGSTAYNFQAESTTIRTYHLDSWSPENTDARFPKFRNGQIGVNTQFSSFWLEDASYFRLKHMELGYQFKWKNNDSNFGRVSLSAENLFVLTRYLGFDPEMQNAASYPLPKLYNLGVNLNF